MQDCAHEELLADVGERRDAVVHCELDFADKVEVMAKEEVGN